MNYFTRFSLLLFLILTSCSNTKIEHVVQVNDSTISTTNHDDWSYTGNTGPSYWSSLDNDYSLCSNGKRQSPVNINKASIKPLPLGINYHQETFKIEREKYTIKLIPQSNTNSINLNGTKYTLIEFHFHTPSEHTVNGLHSDLEVHFIHENLNKSMVTIAVLVNKGNLNKEFQKIMNANPMSAQSRQSQFVKLNLHSFIPYSSKKITYDGSYTTPPCNEGIKWIVFKKPLKFSNKQILFYQNFFYPSNRPVQPLNGRIISESW
ncbi:carbonic anhydrase [Gottfriedia luciferensis]|uniref:carbonic anhydrase n=1 Tax=Gottfriedia luciferensis TaxID=178774 RepID=UPI0013028DBA|nr:carbonic anhydrase family protein [Gottfriedia luciferensis]